MGFCDFLKALTAQPAPVEPTPVEPVTDPLPDTGDLALALKIIKKWEGLILEAYPDPGYGWDLATIGWGTTVYPNGKKVQQGDKITEKQAEEYLVYHVQKSCMPPIESKVKVKLNNNQLCALVSFIYNVGSGNFGSSTLLKKLNAGDYEGSAAQFDVWNKSNGKVLPGLVKRRAEERKLFETPVLAVVPKPGPTDLAGKILANNPGIDSRMVEKAAKFFNDSRISNRGIILLVNFNLSDTTKRLWAVDGMTGKLVVNTHCAVGKNSDQNHDNMPDSFGNVPGSYKSSLGAIRVGENNPDKRWIFCRRLDGLEKGLNEKVRERGIYYHSASYAAGGGDTLGCFGVPVAEGQKLMPLIEGCLLYSWDDSLG